jgi:hypothetical protein
MDGVKILEYFVWKNVFHESLHAPLARFFKQDRYKTMSDAEGNIFKVYEQRTSGSWNTSSGNGIINCIVTLANISDALNIQPSEAWNRVHILVEGDDQCVFCTPEDLEIISAHNAIYKDVAFVIKPESEVKAHSPEQVDYLSHHYTTATDKYGNITYWGYRGLDIILPRLCVAKGVRSKWSAKYSEVMVAQTFSALIDYWPIYDVRVLCLTILRDFGVLNDQEVVLRENWRRPTMSVSLDRITKVLTKVHGCDIFDSTFFSETIHKSLHEECPELGNIEGEWSSNLCGDYAGSKYFVRVADFERDIVFTEGSVLHANTVQRQPIYFSKVEKYNDNVKDYFGIMQRWQNRKRPGREKGRSKLTDEQKRSRRQAYKLRRKVSYVEFEHYKIPLIFEGLFKRFRADFSREGVDWDRSLRGMILEKYKEDELYMEAIDKILDSGRFAGVESSIQFLDGQFDPSFF